MKFLQSWRVRKPADDNESVYISEKFGVRTLHIGSDTVQSAMRIARPNDLEVVYTRSMMAFLLFKPEPRNVHMIGLGGGSLAKFIYHHVPLARVTAVEVNPQVVTIARQFFMLPPNDERLNVMVGDGVEYVARKGLRADVLIVDGYDSESQVAALATLPFYRDCARALGDAITEQAALRRLLATHPGDVSLTLRLADSLRLSGHLEEAERLYSTVIADARPAGGAQ